MLRPRLTLANITRQQSWAGGRLLRVVKLKHVNIKGGKLREAAGHIIVQRLLLVALAVRARALRYILRGGYVCMAEVLAYYVCMASDGPSCATNHGFIRCNECSNICHGAGGGCGANVLPQYCLWGKCTSRGIGLLLVLFHEGARLDLVHPVQHWMA